MQTHREQISVDNSRMNLFVARPEGDKPVPAVVVIQHQYGVDQFMEEMTARTAAEGYFAVTPDLYHRDGPDCKDDGPTRRGRARDVNIIKDVGATVNYLKASKFVDAGRIGILGFCMGGRVAYLMAAASKDFKAAITWYGGSCFRQWGEGPTPFERTAQINCPIQGHFRRNRSESNIRGHGEARRRVDQAWQSSRILRLQGHRTLVYGPAPSGKICRGIRSPVVAPGDGVFEETFGGVNRIYLAQSRKVRKGMIHHEGPSAAQPQPKLGVSPAKTQRAQSSEIEGENHL